jgi:hypothetical protein
MQNRENKIRLIGLAEFGPPENYCYKVMFGLDKAFGKKPRIIMEPE